MDRDHLTSLPPELWIAHCAVCHVQVDLKGKDPEVVRAHMHHPMILHPAMGMLIFPDLFEPIGLSN